VAAITALVAAKRRSAVAEIPSVPVAAATDAAPAKPSHVKVRFSANVPCIVYNGNKEIARLGDTLPLPAGAPITLTCRLEGYEEASRNFVPEDGQEIAFDLVPHAREHASKSSHGKAAPPTKTASPQESSRETLPNPLREH